MKNTRLNKVYSSIGYSLNFKYRNSSLGPRTEDYGKFLYKKVTNNLRLSILLDLMRSAKLIEYGHEDFFYAAYLDEKGDI